MSKTRSAAQGPGAPEITWEMVVEREPRLSDLLAAAQAVSAGDKSRPCTNRVWSGGLDDDGLRGRLRQVVGPHAQAREPILRTREALAAAAEKVHAALPACRDCLSCI